MAKPNKFIQKLMHAKTFAIRKSVVFALVGGLLLGSGGVLLFQWYNPKDAPQASTINMSMIMSRIVDRNELVTASQDYTIVEKAGDQNKLFDFIEIPFTQNSFWYRYSGTIEASVDLSGATWDQEGENTLVVTLEERNNLLNPIHVEDVDEFQRQCIATSTQQAEEGGLKEQAKANALTNLQGMFDVACGEDKCVIEINWVSADGGEQGE